MLSAEKENKASDVYRPNSNELSKCCREQRGSGLSTFGVFFRPPPLEHPSNSAIITSSERATQFLKPNILASECYARISSMLLEKKKHLALYSAQSERNHYEKILSNDFHRDCVSVIWYPIFLSLYWLFNFASSACNGRLVHSITLNSVMTCISLLVVSIPSFAGKLDHISLAQFLFTSELERIIVSDYSGKNKIVCSKQMVRPRTQHKIEQKCFSWLLIESQQ